MNIHFVIHKLEKNNFPKIAKNIQITVIHKGKMLKKIRKKNNFSINIFSTNSISLKHSYVKRNRSTIYIHIFKLLIFKNSHLIYLFIFNDMLKFVLRKSTCSVIFKRKVKIQFLIIHHIS